VAVALRIVRIWTFYVRTERERMREREGEFALFMVGLSQLCGAVMRAAGWPGLKHQFHTPLPHSSTAVITSKHASPLIFNTGQRFKTCLSSTISLKNIHL
jgi:hypothetical protein